MLGQSAVSCLSVLMAARGLVVETVPIAVEDAARVMCALHWTGLNLTPLLSLPVMQAAPSGSIELEGLLSKEASGVFFTELERLRELRAIAEKESPDQNQQMIYDAVPYEVRMCYSGQDGISFTKTFDFNYNVTQMETQIEHILVEESVVQTLKGHGSHGAAGRQVLSIGCGDGRWVARYVQAAFVPEDRLILLDLHTSNLEAAKDAVNKVVALKDVRTVAADLNLVHLHEIDLGAKLGFDVVESSLVLHHVQDLDSLLADVYALLVPGGVFVVSDIIDLNVKESDMLRSNVTYVPPFHGVEFFRTHQEMLDSVSNAGFHLLRYTRVDPATVTFAAQKPKLDHEGEL